MCLGFLSLLRAKILGTWRGRRNDPPHCSAKTSTPHLPVVLHRDYLIDARTHKSHPARTHTSNKLFPGAWLYQWLKTTTVKQGSEISPSGTAVPGVLCASVQWDWQGGKREHKFQELPRGYCSSSSFPTSSLPPSFQSCSLATAVDETLEMTKSFMVFHKSNIFSSVTPAGCSALSVWQQISFLVEGHQISPGEGTCRTMIYGRYL